MAHENDRALEEKLNRARGERRGGSGRPGMMAMGAVIAVAGAGGAYFLALQSQDDGRAEDLTASEAAPFQGQGAAPRLEFPPEEVSERVEESLIRIEEIVEQRVATPAPAPVSAPSMVQVPTVDPDLQRELAELRRQLREEAEARREAAAQAAEEMRSAISELRSANREETIALNARIAEAQREAEAAASAAEAREAALQTQLDAAQSTARTLEEQMRLMDGQSEERMREAQRLADLRQQQEEERRRRAEQFALQIESPAVVFSDGGAAAGPASAARAVAGRRPFDPDEAFLASAPPLVVQEAERMQDPSRTIAQGTIIQAALLTAVNSDLPGNVIATVTDPVDAYSGTRVLIPRGSRMFGSYRSDIRTAQERILIRWSRILTPDGTSLEISAVGADQLGRSGLTGFVDTRFRERFGGAVLISLVGAAPAAAGSASQNPVVAGSLADAGDGLVDASESVLEEQLSIDPTIYVDQGAAVTVLVDRDVIVYER